MGLDRVDSVNILDDAVQPRHFAAEVFTRVLAPRTPIYVPEGVGVVCVQSDDNLISNYNTLYPECRVRGIPFSLLTPARGTKVGGGGYYFSGLNGDSYDICDAQEIARMVIRGGADVVWHSRSHGTSWPTTWAEYFDEVTKGCFYGSGATINDVGDEISAPLEELIGAEYDNVVLDATLGMTHIPATIFASPGGWATAAGMWQYNHDSDYYRLVESYFAGMVGAHHKIGDEGSHAFGDLRESSRFGISTIDDTGQKAIVNMAANTGGACSVFSHEWLTSGGVGSGATPYADNVTHDELIGMLDEIVDLRAALTIVVVGASALPWLRRGTRNNSNILLNGDVAAQTYDNAALPQNWTKVTGTTNLTWETTTGGPLSGTKRWLQVDCSGSGQNSHGWKTYAILNSAHRHWIFRGYLRVVNDGAWRPRIKVLWGAPASVSGTPTTKEVMYWDFNGNLADAYHNSRQAVVYGDGTANDWTYVEVPFSVPYPVYKMELWCGTNATAGGIVGYGDMSIVPNG
uniref:Uncharacterized protein n=1 Tax=viral metagenome TaxID=1070528 RepID=A0A6M3K1P0_9ZZZZ